MSKPLTICFFYHGNFIMLLIYYFLYMCNFVYLIFSKKKNRLVLFHKSYYHPYPVRFFVLSIQLLHIVMGMRSQRVLFGACLATTRLRWTRHWTSCFIAQP